MPLTDLYLAAPSGFFVFVLVLSRIGGLMMTAPVLGMRSAPMRVRAFAAVAVAALVGPLQLQTAVNPPEALLELFIVLFGEIIIGLALGLGVQILFSGIQLTGQIIGQMSGAQIADAFDPTFEQSVPIYSQLLDSVTIAVFVLIGGHRQVMDALLTTFGELPVGGGAYRQELTGVVIDVVTQSFALGLRAAAPAMVALLMSMLVLGLISRTLPQLNILAVGFSLNAMVMLAVMAMSLGGMAYLFQDELAETVNSIRDAIVMTSATER